MRIKALIIAIFALSSISVSAQKKIKDSVSYALGYQMAENLKKNQVIDQLDMGSLTKAVEDYKKGKPRLTSEQSDSVVRAYFTKRYERLKEKNLKEGNDLHLKNSLTKGIVTSASGLQYKIENPGSDTKPAATDEVEVNYKGTLIDGRVFDSSYDRGQSIKFMLNRVIPGWTEGLQKIGEGGKIILYVPPKLGYGEAGMSGTIIEPNATLIFEVELLKVLRKQE